MKRIKLFFAAATLCAAAAVGYYAYEQATMTEQERLMQANLEALSYDDEVTGVGRYRTVACGGSSFHDFATLCCPSQYYDNCPDKGTCQEKLENVQGCND